MAAGVRAVSERESVERKKALDAHLERYRGETLTHGTFASEEFNRLYYAWIQARWDEGDAWVRSVWVSRPESREVA